MAHHRRIGQTLDSTLITEDLASAAQYLALTLRAGAHDFDDAVAALRNMAGHDGHVLRSAAARVLSQPEGEAASELLLMAIPSLLAS